MHIFSGTSYLALDKHPFVIEKIQEGLLHYGTHYGGSRRSPLAPKVYEKAEAILAKWTGAPAALLLSSGSMAAHLLLRYLEGQQLVYTYSPNTHAVLSTRQMHQSQSWKDWFEQLVLPFRIGFTDAIDPLRVRQPNWRLLKSNSNNTLVLDDSHCIGVLGEKGAGSWRQLSADWEGELIITASLGKALAMPAGLILGSKALIADIRSLAQYGGSSPPVAAYMYALTESMHIVKEQQQKLSKRVQYVHKRLASKAGFRTIKNYPVIAVKNHDLAAHLAMKGIVISSFHYPTAEDERYSRIVIRADHKQQQLDQLLELTYNADQAI